MTHEESTKSRTKIIVGTRGSALAQWQTNHVIAALKRGTPNLQIETRIIKTTGDRDQTSSLAELGGLGVFTKEIENALLAREIDLAVHSLKDLPTDTASGLTIAAIPERQDPRDCIVSRHAVGLQQLPRGARVGTSSARRAAQVLALRPDVQVIPLRGNVDTRLRKAQSEEYDAIILAAAGVIRLGRSSEITEYLALETFLPDPGQGALAVEIRADDAELAARVAQLDDAPTRLEVTAERAFLRALGGGCRMPIGAYAEMRETRLYLRGILAADDGSQIARGELAGDAARAEELGAELARRLQGSARQGMNDQQVSSPDTRHLLQSSASPLCGKRILVTRAHGQASAIVEQIRALGGEPVECPTIDLVPLSDFRELDNVLVRVREFDWVVFTSANGVRFVADRLRTLGQDPLSLAPARIAAIGPATSRALEQLGLHVDFVPTKFLGAQIAVELPIERGARALLLRADIASDELARGLAARGVAVTDVDAYHTVMPARLDMNLREIDAITFTSSSTVRNFLAMLGSNQAGLDHARIFCIGPVTADTARELGFAVDAVATDHTADGLVRTMANYYGTRTNAQERR